MGYKLNFVALGDCIVFSNIAQDLLTVLYGQLYETVLLDYFPWRLDRWAPTIR